MGVVWRWCGGGVGVVWGWCGGRGSGGAPRPELNLRSGNLQPSYVKKFEKQNKNQLPETDPPPPPPPKKKEREREKKKRKVTSLAFQTYYRGLEPPLHQKVRQFSAYVKRLASTLLRHYACTRSHYVSTGWQL